MEPLYPLYIARTTLEETTPITLTHKNPTLQVPYRGKKHIYGTQEDLCLCLCAIRVDTATQTPTLPPHLTAFSSC